MNDTPQNLPAVATESAGILAVIERVALDKDADISKLERLLEMQERIMGKNAEIAFNHAMADMQEELPMIEKTSKAHNSKYAKLEDIHEKIAPCLKKHGFSISFNTSFQDKAVIITGTISHREGHSKSSDIRLPIDNSGSKNDVQGMGSTISYGRRYLLGLLLNIVTRDEDNDGNGSDVITIEQAALIDERLNKLGGNKKAFLAYFKVDDVRNILAKDYARADAALTTSEKKAKQPQTKG